MKANLESSKFPYVIHNGDFREYVSEIELISTTHSVFLYVDPFRPGDLRVEDLADVYRKLQQGSSVESLVNFMSRGFIRRAQGLLKRATLDGKLDVKNPEVLQCDRIVGGTSWQELVQRDELSQGQRVDMVARGYESCLSKWFTYQISCPIRDKYKAKVPKYHLVLGSRHPDAVELMNDAMVKAKRELVDATFVQDTLFDIRPEKEIVKPAEVERAVLSVIRKIHRTTWQLLRVETIKRNPCMYKTSEFNRAIKRAIVTGKIASTGSGKKIEDKAEVWIEDNRQG